MLYTEFQSRTMPGKCQQVCVRCGGGWWVWWVWWCKPIIVLSLDQAEQNAKIQLCEERKRRDLI